MGFYERTKKILDATSHHYPINCGRFLGVWWRNCFGSFHLCIVLKNFKVMKQLFEQQSPYKTVLLLATACLCFYFFNNKILFLYLSCSLGVLCLLSLRVANSIHWLWVKFAWVLSLVVPKIILGIVFYLVLTPLAWLSRRMSASDPLQLKRREGTIYRQVDKVFEKDDFDKPW